LDALLSQGGAPVDARRALQAMMTMVKLDVGELERAAGG